MKILAAVLIMTFAFSQSAFAKDSSWLICNNDYLVINVFEHRDSTGSGRETELKLLYGMNLLKGILIEAQSDDVTLLEFPETLKDDGPETFHNRFIGTAHIDYPTTLSLKGAFYLFGFKYLLDTQLACKEITGDLPQ